MAETMIERVAKALCVARGVDPDGIVTGFDGKRPFGPIPSWRYSLLEAEAVIAAMREPIHAALKPFADACEQIDDGESDEEWAKFRLLIKDYRRARDTLAMIDAALAEEG